jgi:hypothetical protein
MGQGPKDLAVSPAEWHSKPQPNLTLVGDHECGTRYPGIGRAAGGISLGRRIILG